MEQTPPKRTRPLADERDAEERVHVALQIARATPLPMPRIEGAPIPNPSLPSNLWSTPLTPSPILRRYQRFRDGNPETPPPKKAKAAAPEPEPEPRARSPSWSSGSTIALSPAAGMVYHLRQQARAKPKAEPKPKLQAHPKTKSTAEKATASSSFTAARVPSLDAADGADETK